MKQLTPKGNREMRMRFKRLAYETKLKNQKRTRNESVF